MFKILIIIMLFFFNFSLANEQPIQAGVKYNEASARIEAFKNVEQKIEKDFLKQFLKDKDKKENLENIKKEILIFNNRTLCPFYIKNTLVSYAITYDEYLNYTFYYNVLGSLIKVDVLKNTNFPRKTYGYSRYGNLISIAFEVDANEQFVYDDNGKLLAHWQGDIVYDKNNKLPKLLKLKRGTK